MVDGFRVKWPRLAALLDDAEDEVLASLAFPPEHWRQIWSTNPLERLNSSGPTGADKGCARPGPPWARRLAL